MTISKTVITKQPSEKIKCAMDFTNWLSGSETINTPVVTFTPNEDLTISAEAISGSTVEFFVEGGLEGKSYRIAVVVASTSGEDFEADGLLKVRGY